MFRTEASLVPVLNAPLYRQLHRLPPAVPASSTAGEQVTALSPLRSANLLASARPARNFRRHSRCGSAMPLQRLQNIEDQGISADSCRLGFHVFNGHLHETRLTMRFHSNRNQSSPPGDAVEIDGNTILDKEEIQTQQTVAGNHETRPAPLITISRSKTEKKVGIEQSSEPQILSFYQRPICETVSPEGSSPIDTLPGQTDHLEDSCRIFAPNAQPLSQHHT